MAAEWYPFIILVIQVLVLFLLTRWSIQKMYEALYILLRNQHAVYSIMSIIFLPGTILHEVSHAIAAIILLMHVREISVFPEWKGNSLKLGKVIYEKKDFIRSILVGIAPIITGLLFFLLLAVFNVFPQPSLLINIALVYLIFTVSTTMFSSKQDLKDTIFLLPVLIIVVGIIYIFQIHIMSIFQYTDFWKSAIVVSNKINVFLFVSLCIHVITVILLQIVFRTTSK